MGMQKETHGYLTQRCTVLASETPEQRRRFYLEVAALMGNTSAAKILAEMKR